MTCRNYMPGPNGDCQRCGEMGMNHAGRLVSTERELLDRIERLEMENDQLRDAVTIWQKLADERKAQIDAQAERLCGEMRAGHAGSDEQFAKEQAQRIMDSADAQYFRWLLKNHSGTTTQPSGAKRCWIGGIEFHGDDIRDAIDAAIERENSGNSG